MNKIVFFDINGTIIERDSRTDLPYTIAIDRYLEVKDGMKGVNNSARSDKDVFMEVLDKHGLKFSEDLWLGFLKVYEECLEEYKTSDVWRPNVDILNFLGKLSTTDYYISMITGELQIGAKYKLEKIGVWNHFPTGGFGEDHVTRFGIAESALEKAKNHYGVDFDEMYVIGDTLLDIKTARHIGAKIISITTGSNSREELLELEPDYLIDSFEEIEGLFLRD